MSVAATVTEGAREMSRTEPGSQAQSCESKDTQTGYLKVKELTCMMHQLLSLSYQDNPDIADTQLFTCTSIMNSSDILCKNP